MRGPSAFFIAFLLLVSPAWARTGGGEAVTIYSDSLKIMDQKGVIQFEGNVRIQLKEATLSCDRLTVHTSVDDPSRVVSGTAVGRVIMERGQERVEAGEADFDLEEGSVDLTGSPFLMRGRTTIQAEKILYSLDEGTAEFLGPVKAMFEAEGE